ncbi:hypothetical protein FOA52_015411 [Chlamydomonas sp. UWO 241]|nr:hypothetical protein FOA52_015411 [Chlamydomonas sp. UWO 241]
MPVIIVTTNSVCADKKSFVQAVGAAAATCLRVIPGHVHVHLVEGQCFGFGGDIDTAGAYVLVKSASLNINPDARKALVVDLAPMLQSALGASPERTTTIFEEVPVEQIAVGTAIMVYRSSADVKRVLDTLSENATKK